VSEAMQRKEMISLALKWMWVLGAVLVLLMTLVVYDGAPNSDADLLLGYGMLTLAFPLGLALAVTLGFLGQIVYAMTGCVVTTSYASIIVTWCVFFVTGYVQWFVLIPRLRSKWGAESWFLTIGILVFGFCDTMGLETRNVASLKVEARVEIGLMKAVFSGLAPHISLEIDRIS